MNYKKLLAAAVAGMMIMSMAACGESGETKEDSQPAQTQSSGEEQKEESTELSGSVSTNGSTSMEKVIGVLSEQPMARPAPVPESKRQKQVRQTSVLLPEH